MVPKLSIKKEKDWFLWGILLVAFLFRFLYLSLKPPHFDEGINGWFTDQLIANGFYRYDPTNYHGPLHFYILMVFKLLMGRNLVALRMSACLFGFAAVYMIAKLDRYVGRFTAYAAAFFVAVSPGMVFYTRYAIHETELLVFSLMCLHGFLRYQTVKDPKSIWWMGLGIAGMIVTKETFFVHLAVFAIAYGCLLFYERFVPSRERRVYVRPTYTWDDLAWVAGVSILIIAVFYSGFFLHMEGIIDLFRSFAAWFATGQKGNGHEKPFIYWFTLFQRYELVAFAGLVLTAKLLLPASRWVRLIGIYGIGIFLAYSIVPYKTPWCIIELIWPFLIVAGSILEDVSIHSKSSKQVALAATLVLGALGAYTSVKLNFFKYVDDTEPYVYVQTFTPIMDVTNRVKALAEKDPSKYHMTIKILMESNWPIPWLLGDFPKALYYGYSAGIDPNAELIISDAKNKFLIEPRLTKEYYTQTFRLRSSQDEAIVYYDAETFKGLIPADAQLIKPVPPEPLKPGAGLLARYYTNADWSGEPVIKKVATQVNFYLDNKDRPLPAPYSLEYTGELNVPTAGTRTFFLSSDDGSSLELDGKIVVDNLGIHPDQMKSGVAELKSGWHKIRIRYNDFGGGMVLHLWWSNAMGVQEEIEPKFFRVKEIKEK